MLLWSLLKRNSDQSSNYCCRVLESNADNAKEPANNPDLESELHEIYGKIEVSLSKSTAGFFEIW